MNEKVIVKLNTSHLDNLVESIDELPKTIYTPEGQELTLGQNGDWIGYLANSILKKWIEQYKIKDDE